MFGVSKTLAMTGLFENLKMFYLMGWVGGWVGWTEDQKCPSNFFILCEDIGNVYTYIYPCSKFVTNFVMGSKI